MKTPAILKYMIGNASVNPKLQHSFLWLNFWLFLRRFELRLGQIPIPIFPLSKGRKIVVLIYNEICSSSSNQTHNSRVQYTSKEVKATLVLSSYLLV